MTLLINLAHPQSCSLETEQFPATIEPDVTLFDYQDFHNQPPPCASLLPEERDLYVTVAGRIPAQGPEDILNRLGAISLLPGIKYWSVTDEQWNVLVTSAAALSSDRTEREDFTAHELANGEHFYFQQSDNRSSGDVIYRGEILYADPGRIIVIVENVSPVKYLLFTVFRPGAIRSAYVFQKVGPDIWGYYNLYGVKEKWESSGKERQSYIHRAIAMYRHFAGIPTDLNPPYGVRDSSSSK